MENEFTHPFFIPPDKDYSDFEIPRRLYASVSEIEEFGEGEYSIAFEAIDAGWWDELLRSDGDAFRPRKIRDALVADSRWPLFIVEVRIQKESRGRMPTEGDWVGLFFSKRSQGSVQFLVFDNLFGVPQETYGTIVPIGKRMGFGLDYAFSMSSYPDATVQEVEQALAGATGSSGVAVYDVGQGNWNAVLDQSGAPKLYYDLGCGVLQNKGTRPPSLNKLCVAVPRTVVLSHWDWDHWAFANIDNQAKSLTWVVPRQNSIGAVHSKFISAIAQGQGNLLVWPQCLRSVSVGSLTVRKCNGSPRNRNDSGLAMIVTDGYGQEILLVGDARYGAVPRTSRSTFLSMVVSHHGSKSSASKVPNSCQSPHGRVVYSSGPSNSYHHPTARAQQAHSAKWLHSRYTDVSTLGLALNRPSHVYLGWSSPPMMPVKMCGNCACDLMLLQT